MLDEFPLLRAPFQAHEHRQFRGNDFNLAHFLASFGHVVKRARMAVEIPFARRVESLEHILDDVARSVRSEVVREYLARLIRKSDEVAGAVH